MADEDKKPLDGQDFEEEPKVQEANGTLIEIYDSLDEFFRVCDRRPYNSWGEYENTRGKKASPGDDFANKTYDETREEAIHGSDVTAEDLAKRVIEADKLFGWDKRGGNKRKLDVRGSQASVPRALMNLPKSMVRKNLGIRKGKIINIVYDVAVNCGISIDQQRRKGAEVVSVLKQLEDLGYRVRFDIMDSYTYHGKAYICRVKLKSEWNSLNIKRVAAICMNACFQRRCMFDWYERLPGAQHFSGYGYPLMNERSAREKFKKDFLSSNDYFITYSDDLKEVFKEQLSLDNVDREDRE